MKNNESNGEQGVRPLPSDFDEKLEKEIREVGEPWHDDEEFKGSNGRTMFDVPTSKDNTVTVLLPQDQIGVVPSQALVRIKSRSKKKGGDGRQYLGVIAEGPFAEPDGLRADAPIVVTTSVRGAMFMPRYHGRLQVAIMGEEIDDGTLIPPRFRPLPNSPVFVLDQAETAEKLKLGGDLALGLAVGYENMSVNLPTSRKDVFPRHLGILGTTGGGKSTTVSGIIKNLSENKVAVIVFDTEGEYTQISEPTEDGGMKKLLRRRGLPEEGVKDVHLYCLIGRETTNPSFRNLNVFGLEYTNLSPYAVMEILELNDAQQQRFLKAYDIARRVMQIAKIFPTTAAERNQLMEIDELEEGYPKLTLQIMYDIVRACADVVDDGNRDSLNLFDRQLAPHEKPILSTIKQADLPRHIGSWRKVQGRLGQLVRLKIFDSSDAKSPNYVEMTKPGQVSIIDLSDTDSPQINNLVIAEILRGLRLKQEENYQASEKKGEPMKRVVTIIEEAHEFLSANRIKQMPILFQQVARIARRGRKRWFGLIFVTQLPQHLPDEIFGLVNNYILHKIADGKVISRLKNSVGGVDPSLWDRLPNLSPGLAIVKAESMARPMLVVIDPTSCKLRLID